MKDKQLSANNTIPEDSKPNKMVGEIFGDLLQKLEHLTTKNKHIVIKNQEEE